MAKGVKDENLMAAIAHAGIIVGGIWILIIWLIQKDKSKYVDFQAKQALLYQVAIAIGAYECYPGKDFKYCWLGDWLAKQ